jgi:branched-chain amino acid transport system substrate-binding protein
MMRRIRAGAAFGALCALGIAASACGSLSDNKGGSGGGGAQGVTDKSIKIGIVAPFSGDAAPFSKTEKMAIAVYKDANAHGGVNGRKIDLVTADSACDPTTVQGVIRKFTDQDKVFMIHGGSCSDAITAAKPLIQSEGIPFLGANAASPSISNPPVKNLFQPKPTADEWATSIIRFLKSNPSFKRIGIVSEPTTWGKSALEPLMAALKGTSLKVVANLQIDRDAGDATPQVTALVKARPDATVVFTYPQPLAVFLRDAKSHGLKGPFLTGDQVRPSQELGIAGDRQAVSQLFTSYMEPKPADDPSFEKWRALWKKYYPREAFDSQSLEGAVSANFNLEVLRSLGDKLTWANWIKTASTKAMNVPIVGKMQFQPFQANDPKTRRPGLQEYFAVLDPSSSEPKDAVVPTWPEWEKLQAGGA